MWTRKDELLLILSANGGNFLEAAAHLSHLQALTWPYLSTGLTFVRTLTDLLRNIPF